MLKHESLVTNYHRQHFFYILRDIKLDTIYLDDYGVRLKHDMCC